MNSKSTFVAYLYRPFTYIAGIEALGIGLMVMVALSVLGYYGGTYFDGALDIHYGPKAGSSIPYVVHLFLQISGWLSLVLVAWLAARLLSKSSFRLLDLAGTMAMAKAPLLFVALWGLAPIAHVDLGELDALTIRNLTDALLQNLPAILISLLVILIPVVWFFILMYNAFSVSTNLKGDRGIKIFFVVLILAEILSKVILHYTLPIWRGAAV